MTKLKVGQKYRVIKDCCRIVKKGTIVTVTTLKDEDSFYDENGNYLDFEYDKIELIKDDKKSIIGVAPTTLNTGDYVRIIKKDNVFFGRTGKIESFNFYNGLPVEIAIGFGNKSYFFLFKYEDLEIVKKENVLKNNLRESLQQIKKEGELIKKLKYVTIKRNGTPFVCRSPDTDEITDKVNELVKQVNKLSKEK